MCDESRAMLASGGGKSDFLLGAMQGFVGMKKFYSPKEAWKSLYTGKALPRSLEENRLLNSKAKVTSFTNIWHYSEK